ncbi:DNA-3-methyladenine glycosylase 2 family protein [Eionea flava]
MPLLDSEICRKARLSRDARFDGHFFTAVKTTKIFCRPICPATSPKEENVTYFRSAVEAANAGYRPCLRCRPDSAPGSPAWKGINTTLERAITLINGGALQHDSVETLAQRLGVSERYVRKLFEAHLGISPKAYALYQQCLFAKQLLHQTQLPITDIALASGFNSVRRFNDCFKKQMQLTPSAIRRKKQRASPSHACHTITLILTYRPPYHWEHMQRFLSLRAIPSLEWCDSSSYGRTFTWLNTYGYFTAHHKPEKHQFSVEITLSDVSHLRAIVSNIRRVLDIDADTQGIERDLINSHAGTIASASTQKAQKPKTKMPSVLLEPGLRLPGVWSIYEAGIRAILGQQVSVAAAHKLVGQLVDVLGETIDDINNTSAKRLFPKPTAIVNSDLDFFKMPGSRKQTLRNLSTYAIDHPDNNQPDNWQTLKGIGPWTINYAKLRGQSNPDIFLGGDLGIKKALALTDPPINTDKAAPWRSYLTMHLWNSLY